MNNLILTLSLFLSLNSFAQSERTYHDEKKQYVFMIDNKNYLFITKNCKKKCAAYKILNKVSTKKVFTKQGQNPGAILCDDVLRKEVVTLRNELGGESTFCRFKDGSMIESSRLFIHAQINDEKGKTR